MNEFYPSKEEFYKRAKLGNLTPVYTEVLADMETPVSAFRKIAKEKYSFLLESVEGGERLARFSFLGSGSNLVIKCKNKALTLERGDDVKHINIPENENILHVLKRELDSFKYVPDQNLPKFCGGAVGFFGYDIVRSFEKLPDNTTDDLDMQDCTLVFTDTLLIFDHVKHKIRVVANAITQGDPDIAYENAINKIEKILKQLKTPYIPKDTQNTSKTPAISSNFTQDDFENAVKKCKEYITSGDIVQVVLSQRFKTKITADPFNIYRALRSLNPSPYMYYLEYDDVKLIGSSPEILVTAEQGNVTIRPIAGTRHRGTTQDEDLALETELLADEKERAEHIMLVDLGRNDIGRVCEYGTVKVNELMAIEKYSHVMHIVSNVIGKLKNGYDQFDLLRACFPAGTVSGAPKIRAMEIIEELEPTRRASYAGSIGYFSYSGNMDTCITIRTILIKDSTAYIQAGAGIVADSDPNSEYKETQKKAMAMINAIEAAERGLD